VRSRHEYQNASKSGRFNLHRAMVSPRGSAEA
jgi:hypothetical protein